MGVREKISIQESVSVQSGDVFMELFSGCNRT